MSQHAHHTQNPRSLVCLGAAVAALLCFGLLAAASASAAFEQVGNFAGKAGELHKLVGGSPSEWPEEVQLGGLGGMAVNYTGAGGVPAGTIYTVRSGVVRTSVLISRYNPDGSFSERWTFKGTTKPEERCGPEGEPAQQTCDSYASESQVSVDVDVDQTTGYVYVFGGDSARTAGEKIIHVYTPDGSKVIAEFGEAAPAQSTAESPEKLHTVAWAQPGAIAVDATGDVYVFDINRSGLDINHSGEADEYHRLMRFEPQSPGDYEHYVYAGQNHDLRAGFKKETALPQLPVADAAGNLYVSQYEGSNILKLDPSQPSAPPLCEFKVASNGVLALTVNPQSGEAFFFSEKNRRIHQLSAGCNGEGKFTETGSVGLLPNRSYLTGLAFDPVRQFSPGRPAGVLYAGSPGSEGGLTEGAYPETLVESSLGYIFSQPVETPPVVGAESFSHVTSTTAELGAQVNPKGSATNYVFQYLPDSAYEANEPDEVQSLTVSATGGLFDLGFEGERLGGEAVANLGSGSNKATALKTVTGTGTLKAASGTGDLTGAAKGKGTTISGSQKISSVVSEKGKFEAEQGIVGKGIPSGATITKVAVEAESGAKDLTLYELTISAPATESATHLEIASTTNEITALSTKEGVFEVGQIIEGEGIPTNTTITAVGAGELTLSVPVSIAKSGVALKAGSAKVTSLAQGIGAFEVGQIIEGVGIPANTTITAIGPGELTLSRPATKPGSAVAISSPGPNPLALSVGEQVEGPGIPAGTKITSVEAGQLTLSNPASASTTGALLHLGISATAGAAQVRLGLEGLAKIGEGGVRVSGGPGDESGANPYRVTFTGRHENLDVPELETEDLTLSGGSSSATVQTEYDGGGGFSVGALEAPGGGAFAGEGNEPVTVTGPLVGLQPGTAYHFRAVATSHCSAGNAEKICEGTGETLGFRTAPAETAGLPDHRAYELVSPAVKGGGEVIPTNPEISSCPSGSACKLGVNYNGFPMQAAPDGDAIVYEGSPFDSEHAAAQENQYIARRTTTGWQTTNLTPTHLGTSLTQGYKAFATDLRSGVLKQGAGGVFAPPLSPDAPPGDYQDLYTQTSENPPALEPLLSEGQVFHRLATEFQLEYAGASADGSRIFFVANDALTEATSFAPEAVDGGSKKNNLYEWHEGRLSLVNVLPGETTQPGASFGSISAHTISSDGTRAFFSDESGQVYVREDGETTREIMDEGSPDPGNFVTAAVDGSKVLLSNGHLHLLDEEGEPTVDLTQGKGGFQGVVGESEDLSHVYFVDTEVLDETPNAQGEEAEAGKDNLYAWAQDEGTHFVAQLLASDGSGDYRSSGADWAAPAFRTAEASPNGNFLAFVSRAQLTGYDNNGPCGLDPKDNTKPGPGICAEVFLYDSAKDKLVCASCNPSGQHPLGRSFLTVIRLQGGSATQPRYLSDSGRLSFDSRDSLLPVDSNHGVEDVYQWEPKGVGSCEAEFAEGGCVSLISAGTGTGDSNLVTTDPSGKNVFFTTRDQLSLKDKDGMTDLYDAREGGGIGAESEVARTECQGEACQAQTSAPNDPTPGSSTFQGAGNVKEEVKAKKHSKKHKKKHAKKKHAHKRAAKSNRGGAK